MKLRLFLALAAVSVMCLCHAQGDKGISIPRKQATTTGTTRALVVGISRYQHIASLQFADKDAIAFAEFLTSNKEYNITDGNLVLLTNENAKSGDIISAINWLIEVSDPGDRIIFYFSGHGDVETSTDANKGYLLGYDCPKNNYATGAIGADILQKAFTAVLHNDVKLFLVTDACRSGHLAGGVAGAQQTAKAFSQRWQNETRLLSAQPDELSYEGAQWGGGRGVFSFYLVKGLTGYADINNDTAITLLELEQYVGLQVAAETQYQQQPVFEGPNKFNRAVAVADPQHMKQYGQWSPDRSIIVAVTAPKGNVGATGCAPYDRLLEMLRNNTARPGGMDSLIAFYNAGAFCNESLQSMARNKLSAAIINEVQEVVNNTLVGKELVITKNIDHALTLLEKVFTINHDKQMIYRDHLENLRRYLQVYGEVVMADNKPDHYRQRQLHNSIDTALKVEPGAAYLFQAKALNFLYLSEQKDSAFFYFLKAIGSSPTWLMPKWYMAVNYEKFNMYDSAAFWLNEILAMDSLYKDFECIRCFYLLLGDVYLSQRKYKDARDAFLTAYAKDPSDPQSVSNLVFVADRMKDKKLKKQFLDIMDAADTSLDDKILTVEYLIQNRLISGKEAWQRIEDIRKANRERNEWLYLSALLSDEYSGKFSKNYCMAYEILAGHDGKQDPKYRIGCLKYRFAQFLVMPTETEFLDELETAEYEIAGKLSFYDQYSLEQMRAFFYLFYEGDDTISFSKTMVLSDGKLQQADTLLTYRQRIAEGSAILRKLIDKEFIVEENLLYYKRYFRNKEMYRQLVAYCREHAAIKD